MRYGRVSTYSRWNIFVSIKGVIQWIGATDLEDEGNWIWTDGSPVKNNKNNKNWWPREPNNCCGGQHCVATNYEESGKWDDKTCSITRPFHCQVLSLKLKIKSDFSS